MAGQQYDPSKMTLRELLDLYRGVDMREFDDNDYVAFPGAGPGARIGSTDDMVVVEDTTPDDDTRSVIAFYPIDPDLPCVSVMLELVVA